MAKWTDEEIGKLKALFHKETVKEIAERVGHTYRGTSQQAKRLGLHKEFPPPKRVTKWVDAYKDICDEGIRLHESGVPVEIRSRWVKSPQMHEQVAIFRIYPRSIEEYWNEHAP